MSVTDSWMSHKNKNIDDRLLFVIDENEASAIVCYDSVFAHHLIICQGDPQLCTEWVRKKFGDSLIDPEFTVDPETSSACHFRGVTRNTCLIWSKVPRTDEASLIFALIAHEAVHYAYALLEVRGMKPHFKNEELVAYVVQWVMSNYLQCIGLQSEDHPRYQKVDVD